MPPARKALRVRPLTAQERETLLSWVRDESVPAAWRRRARVILLSSYDISTYVIGILIPMGRNNVGYWIRRFNEDGLEGLRDRPRPGRPPLSRRPLSDDMDEPEEAEDSEEVD